MSVECEVWLPLKCGIYTNIIWLWFDSSEGNCILYITVVYKALCCAFASQWENMVSNTDMCGHCNFHNSKDSEKTYVIQIFVIYNDPPK